MNATHLFRSVTVAMVTASVAVSLVACSSGEDNEGDRGTSLGNTGGGSTNVNVDSFVAMATAAGWTCIAGGDPFTGKPGATCSPGPADVMTKAAFAVFDRSEVADGAAAVHLAGEATAGQVSANGTNANEGNITEQFRPLDSDTLAGYCVNTMNACAANGFDNLGLRLG